MTKGKQHKPETMQKNPRHPSTSLIVTTYNWPEALEMSLRSIFRQTRLPDEIIVADDGSTDETRRLVERLCKESLVPMVYVWQEDRGFRLSAIRNKAIARASGEYILQTDGDVILSRHFVSDHLELAEYGFFVCGSRVKLLPEATSRIMARGNMRVCLWDLPLGYMPNAMRSRLLRHYFATRYAHSINHLRGCNMAFWKRDVIKVNGYNEDLTQWGHEDGEFAYRLHFAGVGKKALKMGGVVYHLHHKEASRDNEQRHFDELENVKDNKLSWCKNGIDKYLP